MKKLCFTMAVFSLIGCTSVNVHRVDESHKINKICIEKNEAVIFSEFLDSIKNRIDNHNIETIVFDKWRKPNECDYTLWYTALRSWDIIPYLSHAELRLYYQGLLIGDATYHLRGKGGFSLTKWASVSSKMNPVVDELLNKK